ncbi:hypothetical protein P4O66_001543 [Electrophorus voltai]|uniref:ZP domain-containing protein n=1 Tax=Electrophorus voltai TaxID=2609070 RepID=A0AAD9DW70_9TELE|nr:hypothetical protein P4O66_001543 [Electrophorus voltai]
MGFALQLCLVALLFARPIFVENPFPYDGASVPIELEQTFVYAGRNYSQLYLSMNGFLSFFSPPDEFYPTPFVAQDGIFPMWVDIENDEGGDVWYFQDTEGNVTSTATLILEQVLGEYHASVTWVFIATWSNTPLELEAAAGFAENGNTNFIKLPISDSSALSTTSNIGFPGLWVFSVQNGPNVIFFPIGPEAHVNPFLYDGTFVPIDLEFPFLYNGTYYTTLYLDMNGFVSFFEPPWEFYPISNINQDMIAPFWSDIENDEGGRIFYEQAKEGPLLAVATDAVKQAFPDTDFEEAVWVFVATWLQTPLELAPVDASFQVVLTADDDGRAYVLMNYGDIPSVQNIWVAGLAFNNFNFSSLPVQNSSDLPLISNVGFPGRWAFEVGFYDAIKTCSGSSGTASFSRCQLFEAGYPSQFLHLNDYSCKGVVDGDRLVFHFDNDGHNCGTYLWNNETHFIYENMVQSLMGEGDQSVISRDGWLGIDISCVYPLIQSISMPMMIQADPSVVYRYLPTDGTYQIHMVPYPDASFSTPYSGEVVIEVNQQIFVGVEVVGVDNRQISIVLDRCWATPVADMNYNIYWNLIINECPNPEDGTVQVLQNGVATSSYFSFRMFTFTSRSSNIFLHCQVHLCLLENGNCLLNQLHDPNQSGYKLALIVVTENLHAAKAAKQSSVLILLDLSAAFDTVNHNILLSVLSRLGVTGSAWRWFQSYLDGRSYQSCTDISDNMGYPLQLCLVVLLFAKFIFQPEDPFPYYKASVPIDLDIPFVYAGRNYSQLYLDRKGFVSFSSPPDEFYPDLSVAIDGFVPLWIENYEGRNISYTQATEGPLITQATDCLNELFLEYNSTVTWVFVATWFITYLENDSANVTFQAVLITDDEENSYVLMSYMDIPSVQTWLINENGFQSFLPVSSWTNPDPYANGDIIAPLWTSFNADLIYYQQVTDGPLLARATVEINSMFLGLYFSASWLFITTWVAVPYSSNTGVATFQMVLVGGEDDELSFLLMNYGDIAPTGQPWLAGYRSESGIYKYTIDEPNPSDLSKSTNKGLPGQWAFRVDEEMDATETCSDSSGTVSLSRCQLFEAGYPSQFLHLSDYKCKGVIQGDRVVFNFDYHGHTCGTILMNNATHFMYTNKIEAIMGEGDQTVISRDSWLRIDISCVYPLIESISMPMSIKVEPRCPNPEDGTTQILENGVSTSGRFSFRMFTFTKTSTSIFLHCNMHLCLVENGNCVLGSKKRKEKKGCKRPPTACTRKPPMRLGTLRMPTRGERGPLAEVEAWYNNFQSSDSDSVDFNCPVERPSVILASLCTSTMGEEATGRFWGGGGGASMVQGWTLRSSTDPSWTPRINTPKWTPLGPTTPTWTSTRDYGDYGECSDVSLWSDLGFDYGGSALWGSPQRQ